MTKLEKLHNLIYTNNIALHFFDLKDSLETLGMSIEKEGAPHMILLDYSLKNDIRVYEEVLAHELGHYFSTTGDLITCNNSYRQRLYIEKHENKANRWAYNFLISEKEIINAINKNIHTVYDIAVELNTTVEILIKRLEYLSRLKQTLDLGNDRFLVLTNLPNLYIYNKI